ncbi:MAG: NAD-dependent epimerase/dehydratase family protein, partial [Pirellulales bacterium]
MPNSHARNFVRRAALPVGCEAAFRYHERPGAIQRMIPPWESVRVERHDGIQDGDRAELVNYLGPLPMKWVVEHRDYVPGRQFRDVQLSGPFAHWNHLHRFEPLDANTCFLEDKIEYALPAGGWGAALGGSTVENKLNQMFLYRHQRVVADLNAHAKYKDRGTMKIAITGASGLVGSDLCAFLSTGGHEVKRLVRSEVKQPEQEIYWKPSQGVLRAEDLEGLYAVIHLGGESIAEGRWNDAKKQRIRDSRVDSTRLLAEALAQLENPPRTFICASAIGFYGDRGDEVLTEESAAGEGFLPEVCQQWEAACDAARDKSVRVVHARFGMILSPQGGALAKMLTPFKLGGGGVIGGG